MNQSAMTPQQRAAAAQAMQDHAEELERIAHSTRLPDTALIVQVDRQGAYVAAHIIPTNLQALPQRDSLKNDYFVLLPAGQSVTRESLLAAIAAWQEQD